MHPHLRRRSLRLGLVTLASAVACAEPSGSSSERREHAGEVAGEVAPREAPGRPVEVVAASVTCEAPPAPSTASERARAAAVDAMLAGRPEQAVLDFEALIRASPRDLGAQALAGAARELLAASQERVAALSDQIEPVRVEPLPRAARIVERLRLAGVDPVTLTISSAKANLITDDADWLARVGVEPPGRRVFRGRGGGTVLPPYVASALRGRPAQAIYTHADHVVVVYGDLVGVFAAGRSPRAFDVSAAMASSSEAAPGLELLFAQLVGDTLVVQLAYNGYASESGEQNAYVAAFDGGDGRLRWSSEALVGNSQNFVIAGSRLITGYGFTDEPDALFVLDLASGETAQRIALKSGPQQILARGDELFVRTYNTDYVLRAAPGLTAAPAASLAPAPPASAPPSCAELRCFLDAALSAIDRRDVSALDRALDGLDKAGAEGAATRALRGVRLDLAARAADPKRWIDLSTQDPIAVAAPPWAYHLARPTERPRPRPLRLLRRRAPIDSVEELDAGSDPALAGEAVFIAPVEQGALPSSARPDIPSSYAGETLRAIIRSGEAGLLLVYGGRYLAILEGSTTTDLLDLDAFRRPPAADPAWRAFAEQDVTYAQVVGRTLYVSNGGGSYARDVYGKKGFLSAIDLDQKALIWRSDPLVASWSFVIVDDLIVTGYGFTDEPDHLFVLWTETGEKLAQSPLDSAPSRIRAERRGEGALIRVTTYKGASYFDLTRGGGGRR